MEKFSISANFVDLHHDMIYPAVVTVENGIIASVQKSDSEFSQFILPGFIDAHVHVESSMLIPSEFARLSVLHGTVATVSDPHEIANVLGLEGIRYMIENGKKVPFKFYFGASSCVPATDFETAGATVTAEDIRELFESDGLIYMSEMMNYPGVIYNDSVVMKKIEVAKSMNIPIDGHAPGLMGDDARKYFSQGISTDHECYMLEEAMEKLALGVKILIREGSAAKNYNALHTLIPEYYENIMFCSDDKHPDDLLLYHINGHVKRSVANGYDIFKVLKIACVNPVEHYRLNVGLLREGDPADFIVVNNLEDFEILQTYIDGVKVADKNKPLIESITEKTINNFNTQLKENKDFEITAKGDTVNAIEALDGELITNSIPGKVKIENGNAVSNVEGDILKITVVERYGGSKPSIGFIKNFGLKKGAIASCVAHDSHNIVCVGVTDEDIRRAVNAIIENKGGISVCTGDEVYTLPLPVAGIMSNEDGYSVAKKYSEIDKLAKSCGTKLLAPFMTLSFMALLVIPSLKLGDKGLFDVSKFQFTELFAESNQEIV
ncbi:MAG: adenine deaminase [Ignavibacteriaceae bacterium]|nr:adenine deaminase [Ignavibacteriaceae bacterium]